MVFFEGRGLWGVIDIDFVCSFIGGHIQDLMGGGGSGLEEFIYIQHTVSTVVKIIDLVSGASSNKPVTLN